MIKFEKLNTRIEKVDKSDIKVDRKWERNRKNDKKSCKLIKHDINQ